MGNMLPCLVQASSSIMPRINTKQWSGSMKFLSGTLHRTTKRPHCSNRVAKAAARRETSAPDDQASPRTRSRRGPSRNGHNRRVVRVKVILTRAEAARLMSLTTHGDRTAKQVVAEFKRSQQATSSKASAAQAISELKRMEALIARADTSASASTAWRPVLESIPEEW
ncbi:uncharacterized protein [Miscanthus floridulus]|uniref:uncharacterized protein n=1 Tax=Miscanthus floridulus TaxID=154761 RepID=UPI00345B2E1F